MEDLLISLLEEYNYPVFRQGSMTENEIYPPTFFTFWNSSSDDMNFYDNSENATAWEYDVNIYSNDPEIPYTLLKDVKKKLKKNGFIATDNGHDVASDNPSHIGRGFEVVFIERR